MHYYDNSEDSYATRPVSTGIVLELYHEGEFVAGRVEHRQPEGYFFEPLAQSTIQSFPLQARMLARLTEWKYGNTEENLRQLDSARRNGDRE